MNIMIINHYAGSEKYGMEFRPYYLGRELVKLGHEVTVIASDCSHLRIKNPEITHSVEEEYIDGVRYVFIKSPKYKKNNLKRVLNVAGFLWKVQVSSKLFYKRYAPEVIIASSTYPYDMRVAKSIAKHDVNIRVCFEVHDIWPLSLIELYKISPNNPAMRHLQRAEIYAIENADTVISLLPHVNRHIEELGFHDINYVYVPNGVKFDPEIQQEPPQDICDKIAEIRLDGKMILMYLGGFSKANALDDLLESAKFMDENIHIVMIGSGPQKAEYEGMVRVQSLTNVTILPPVAKLQVNKTLHMADILYIGAKKTKLYKYGVGMNKIYDYMLSKRPIIYGIDSSNDIIADSCCGISIEPEVPAAIAFAVKELSEYDKDIIREMGENGYNYVMKNHDYEKLAKRYAVVLQ